MTEDPPEMGGFFTFFRAFPFTVGSSTRSLSQYGLLHFPHRNGLPFPLNVQSLPHRRQLLITITATCPLDLA
jgi:hypothetical protein